MKFHSNKTRQPRPSVLACALAGCLLVAIPSVYAQTVDATLRGHVTTGEGSTGSATVTATNLATNASRTAQVGADGSYVLVGLKPGNYRVDAKVGSETVSSETVTVQIGQSANLDLGSNATGASADDATNLEAVKVVGHPLPETRTSEVAKNVSRVQIEALPQNSRNFLNFAGLAAGVTVPVDQNQKGFSAAGQPSNQTNVFIDGANLKNNILQGGLVGQDSSKGNPFSQEAIQEFRVLVQNYKAEYEQAGTATITAITKSGSNDFHGSIYDYLQTKGMVEQEKFANDRGDPKADYRRDQFGATLGGPIVKDKLFFFLNYEGNREDGSQGVNFTNPAFTQYNGTFPKPFREDVWFGKLTWYPTDNDTVDFSISRRRDVETLGFGGQTAYEARQLRKNSVDDYLFNWKHSGDGWLNEVLIDNGRYAFNPTAANPNLVSQNFFGAGLIGGASSLQDKKQRNVTLRDDLTFSDLTWHGTHVVKMGAKYATYNLNLLENNNANPAYNYNPGLPTGYDAPFEAFYSPQGKFADINNSQFGLYIQDDWDVNKRLQLNLGLRWDYETDPFNKDYVTPQNNIDVINFLGLSSDYISTGNNRKSDKGQFQPRIGFSYDFSGANDQSWVVFGGAGRYYDRIPLDNPIQESFHSQYPYYHFYFS
ncbi:MAG: TonB-dependent receptor, partial [Pseudoxanthomonas sp.]